MSFILLILYLICTFLRPQEWVPGMIGWRLINALALGTFFFIFVERGSKKKGGLINVPHNKMLLGFFLAIMMSHIAHTYFAGLSLAFSSFYTTILLYFLVLNAVNTTRKLKIATWVLALVITLLAFQGIFQIKHGYGWAWQPLTVQHDGIGGMTERINWIGIFGDPNDLALIFVIALGLVLPFFFGKSNFILKLLSLGIGSSVCWGVYLTNSRGGLLALMTTVFVFFIKKTKKFVLGGIIGGLGGAAILLFGPSRMGAISSSEASAASRIDFWYQGLLMFKSNPIFGVGYGMYMEEMAMTAHNSYVLAFAELGFVGLFFWMGLFYFSYKSLNIVQQKNAALKNYALGIQSALMGFAAAAFFLSRTYTIVPYLLFALSGSMIYITQQQNPEIKFKINQKDLRNIALISAGIIIAVVITIRNR